MKLINLIRAPLYFVYTKLKNQIWLYEDDLNIRKGLLTIGKHTYSISGITIDNYKGSQVKVTIGAYCSIAKNIRIITGGIHPAGWVSLFPFRINWRMENAYQDGLPATKGPVIIGNDVWISTGVTILSGVAIGDGAILMANTVVTNDVPAYAVIGGIPAKITGYRFDTATINELLRIKWWLWDDKKVRENVPLLSSENIDKFIKLHKLPSGS